MYAIEVMMETELEVLLESVKQANLELILKYNDDSWSDASTILAKRHSDFEAIFALLLMGVNRSDENIKKVTELSQASLAIDKKLQLQASVKRSELGVILKNMSKSRKAIPAYNQTKNI